MKDRATYCKRNGITMSLLADEPRSDLITGSGTREVKWKNFLPAVLVVFSKRR